MSHESVDTHVPASARAVRNGQALSEHDITASESAICQFTAFLHQEAFSPIPIPHGLKCRLLLTGTCFYHWSNGAQGVDAFYKEDISGRGNYIIHHALLLIDRKTFDYKLLAEDRALHRYMVPYTGKGAHLGILLKAPTEFSPKPTDLSGALEVAVLPVPPPPVKEVVVQSVVDDQREEEKALQRRALAFATQAHLEKNFLDQEFRERYAATYLPRILKEEKQHWLNLYQNVLADCALHSLIQSQYPHVMPYLESLLETARIADRLAVADPRKKPKLSREEWEARIERYRQRQVDRLRVGADDKIAKLLARYKSLQHLRERAVQLGLDVDTIDRLEQELRGDMDDEDDGQNTGYRQLG
jgi:hypothetical protein